MSATEIEYGIGPGELSAQHAAVVAIDMVNAQTHRDGVMARMLRNEEGDLGEFDAYFKRLDEVVVPNAARVLVAARTSRVPVIFICGGAHRADASDSHPKLGPFWRQFGQLPGEWGGEIIEALTPGEDDIRLLKYGSGGYYGSLLDPTLRNLNVHRVIYLGVLTDACVLLHCAEGFDRGFEQWVVADATAALTPRAHDIALEIMAPFMAATTDTDCVVAALGRA